MKDEWVKSSSFKSLGCHFEKGMQQTGRGTAPVRYLIYQKIVDAVPLKRIYLLPTLFELP
ncbi:hypothetical protein NIES2107_71990 (plasmid) [Nostoc carneum NIES-2107]|nr:hypothetical protein NIES2107_71990 [Nostoc carneum NIES-2107]